MPGSDVNTVVPLFNYNKVQDRYFEIAVAAAAAENRLARTVSDNSGRGAVSAFNPRLKSALDLMFAPDYPNSQETANQPSFVVAIERYLHDYVDKYSGKKPEAAKYNGIDDDTTHPVEIASNITKIITNDNIFQKIFNSKNKLTVDEMQQFRDLQKQFLAFLSFAITMSITAEDNDKRRRQHSLKHNLRYLIESFNRNALAMMHKAGADHNKDAIIILLQLQKSYHEHYRAFSTGADKDGKLVHMIADLPKPETGRKLLEAMVEGVLKNATSAAASQGAGGAVQAKSDDRNSALSFYKNMIEIESKSTWYAKYECVQKFFDLVKKYIPGVFSKTLKLEAVDYLQLGENGTPFKTEADRDAAWIKMKKDRYAILLFPPKSNASSSGYDSLENAQQSKIDALVSADLPRIKKAVKDGILGHIDQEFKAAAPATSPRRT